MSIQAVSAVLDLGPEVAGTNRLVLISYANHANDEGYSWPKRETITREAGTSPNRPGTITAASTWLDEHGWIDRDINGAAGSTGKIPANKRPNLVLLTLDNGRPCAGEGCGCTHQRRLASRKDSENERGVRAAGSTRRVPPVDNQGVRDAYPRGVRDAYALGGTRRVPQNHHCDPSCDPSCPSSSSSDSHARLAESSRDDDEAAAEQEPGGQPDRTVVALGTHPKAEPVLRLIAELLGRGATRTERGAVAAALERWPAAEINRRLQHAANPTIQNRTVYVGRVLDEVATTRPATVVAAWDDGAAPDPEQPKAPTGPPPPDFGDPDAEYWARVAPQPAPPPSSPHGPPEVGAAGAAAARANLRRRVVRAEPPEELRRSDAW